MNQLNAREVGLFGVALYNVHRRSPSFVLVFEKIASFTDIGPVKLQKLKASEVFRIAYISKVTLVSPVEKRPFRSCEIVFKIREGWNGIRATVAFMAERIGKVDR